MIEVGSGGGGITTINKIEDRGITTIKIDDLGISTQDINKFILH